MLEGALILLAALAIAREAYFGFADPRPLESPALGLAVSGLASGINAAWAWTLVRHGRRVRSPALEASGRHVFTDVLSSVGVIAGIALAALTGWTVLDPTLAALVALNVLWSGWVLVRNSVGGLMDEALPAGELARVRRVVADAALGALEAHNLRTRRAGHATFVEFHLVVPGNLSVREAHDLTDRVEAALQDEIPGSVVTIHLEPEGEAEHHGVVVL